MARAASIILIACLVLSGCLLECRELSHGNGGCGLINPMDESL